MRCFAQEENSSERTFLKANTHEIPNIHNISSRLTYLHFIKLENQRLETHANSKKKVQSLFFSFDYEVNEFHHVEAYRKANRRLRRDRAFECRNIKIGVH